MTYRKYLDRNLRFLQNLIFDKTENEVINFNSISLKQSLPCYQDFENQLKSVSATYD